MANTTETEQITDKIATAYGLQVSKDVVASVFAGRPKLPVLLSRASFRPDVDVRTKQRTRAQKERRNFLRGIFGFVLFSASALVLLKIATVSSTQPETSTTVPSNPSNPSTPSTQPQTPTTLPGNPSNPSTQTQPIIGNAANISPDQSITYNDPSLGPIILIHLDNGQFVAYSSICTHAGCQVQFDPSGKEIICPCHGATFDPYNNAQVTGGPAPYPLQKIPIQYDPSTGNIYSSG
ncbi:MAG: Rieske 2Fe-2S domain-containing protein [Candidatus Bathyarchaeia archaeon]